MTNPIVSEVTKAGNVSIIGSPNVGKSTLLNALIGQKIAITADKPQTTRHNVRGILTEQDFQAVFIDTPGIHTPVNSLHRHIVDDAKRSLSEADLVLLVINIRNGEIFNNDDKLALEALAKHKLPVVLVINKIDRCSQEEIYGALEKAQEIFNFREIIPVCALKRKNLPRLIKIIRNLLPSGAAIYPLEEITDSTVRELSREFIRESVFRSYNKEVPYQTEVEIEKFVEQSKRIEIYATIHVGKESHKKIIIGKAGANLADIGRRSRLKIQGLLGAPVFLKLNIRVSGSWYDNASKLKDLGYE